MSNQTAVQSPVRALSRGARISSRLLRRAALLAGVSSAALLMITPLPSSARALGSSGVVSPVFSATDAAAIGAQQAAAVARQSMSSLTRATQALQAMRGVQAAARAAAAVAPGTVSNGRAGLVPDPRIGSGAAGAANLWVNANLPIESRSGDQTTVTIAQTAPRAVMTWQKFDVGAQTTLVYDQRGNRDWIALNRIDATGVPSRIAGQIKADGTVLIINPNGIIFNGTSQVNVNSLIATTHDLIAAFPTGASPSSTYVQSALQAFYVPPQEDNANTTFLNNGLLPEGTNGILSPATFALGDSRPDLSALRPDYLRTRSVEVQAGALLNANVSGSNDGGYVALMAPQVVNAGTIGTGNGSIHLLAGSTAALTSVSGQTNIVGGLYVPTNFTQLSNGLATIDGTVTNAANGLLVARTGLVNMIGPTLNQLGGIDVTTGVSRRGAITLYGNFGPNGPSNLQVTPKLALGADSVLSIAPAQDGGSITAGALSNDPSYFKNNLQPTITIESNSIVVPNGALIRAPAAALTLSGSDNVVLKAGSVIDLSGMTSAVLPMSSNLLSILVTPNEIADSPLASALVGKTVVLDARLRGTRADGTSWVGSPIVNAAGYADAIPVSIDQVLAGGGSVTLTGGMTLLQEPGSVINVSGGYVTYTGGVMKTTRLIGSDGRLYAIGSADPALAYRVAGGFTVDHARWGIQETYAGLLFNNGHIEPGYVAGSSAGSIIAQAVNPILMGGVVGDVVIGRRQMDSAQGGGSTVQTSLEQLPSGAKLSLTFAQRELSSAVGYTVVLRDGVASAADYDLASFTPETLQWLPRLPGGVFPLFTDALNAANFGSISITGAYDLSMATGAHLAVRPGGSINLANVSTIDGELQAPGGTITLAGFTALYTGSSGSSGQSSYQLAPTPAVVIGPHAVLDVAGRWVNDYGQTAEGLRGAAAIDGGSVSIITYKTSQVVDQTAVLQGSGQGIVVAKDVTQGIILAPGSIIDASSGGYINGSGKVKTGADGLPLGKGGNIALTSYADRGDGGWKIAGAVVAASDITVTNSAGTIVYGVIPTGATYLRTDDPNLPGIDINRFVPTAILGDEYLPDQGNVVLGGAIYAAGFSGGGTFTLQAPTIRIGDNVTTATTYGRAPVNSALAAQLAGRFGMPATDVAQWLTAGGAPGSPTAPGTVVLPSALLSGAGFGGYSITSTYGGLTVTAGSIVAPVQTNLRADASVQTPTGASTRLFATTQLLADGLRKPVDVKLGANSFIYDTVASPRGFLLEDGAHLATEATGNITIVSQGLTRILGSIAAPAGDITVYATGFVAAGVTTNAGLWIGSDAVLDVSGTFLPDPRGTTRSAGQLLDAGDIILASRTTVVEASAQLLLKGSTKTVEASPAGILSGLPHSQLLWSGGGNLLLGFLGSVGTASATSASMYFAGRVDASGGAPGAKGGTFALGGGSIAADTMLRSGTSDQTLFAPNILVEASGTNVAAGFVATPTRLADLGAPTNRAFISADTLNDSGFESVSLISNESIAFVGSVNLRIPGALTLQATSGSIVLLPKASAGALVPVGLQTDIRDYSSPTAESTTVDLDAGYLRLVGSNRTAVRIPSLSVGTLNARAQWIDLQRSLSIGNATAVDLTSSGAIRALPDIYGFEKLDLITGATEFGGAFYAPGNLTLRAAAVFPASNTHFLIESYGSIAGANTLTIRQNGVATAPLSAGGGLYLGAQNIVQAGTLWAPLGKIVLGITDSSQLRPVIGTVSSGAPITPTVSVTLAAGSLTSVSADGLTIPYGQTIDGIAWYAGTYSSGVTAITSPSSKTIDFNTSNLLQQHGAVVDISGGGDVYATEFIRGTGGSRNVLATYQVTPTVGATANDFVTTPQYGDARQVYALVPSYLAPVAAYDSTFATYPYYSGQNAAALTVPGTLSNLTGIAPGTAVRLDGGNGIPAGTYTLLPGMYATLPGAYRVVQVVAAGNPAMRVSATTADGSLLISGRMVNGLTGNSDGGTAIFQLQSNAVWSKYSRVDIASGNSYFAKLALTAGTLVPRLPRDGGVASFGASSSLDLLGTFLAAPATGGRGGVIAISAENILVKAADRDAPATANGYLLLDADQVSSIGAGQVVLGGRVSFTTSGPNTGMEVIDAQAKHVEILTDDQHPLTGASLVLASRSGGLGITIDSGSVIGSSGPADAVDNTAILATAAGDNYGALLRVATGGLVDIFRTFTPNADAATTPGAITIGTDPGTAMPSATGGAVSITAGALTLETSGSVSFGNNVKLQASDYELTGPVVSLGNTGGVTGGIRLSTADFGRFAGARSLRLRSATVFNLYDIGGIALGDAARRIAALTFDGAGFYSAGGSSVISAANIQLINSRGATGSGIGGANGTLTLDASETITDGVGAKSFAGLGNVNWNAGQAVIFTGAGTTDSGPMAAAALTFNVGGASIVNGGAGYTSAPTVTISGGGGSGATATATLGVVGFTMAVAGVGSGLTDGAPVTLTSATGSGFVGTAIVTGGVLRGIKIVNPGTGYTSVTAVKVGGTTVTGVTASLGVADVTITNPGSGYSGIPNVSFSGGGGNGATAQALGRVTGVNLTNKGDGYIGTPVVTVTGGGGSGTSIGATAAGGVVTGLTLNTGGTGYSSLPTITVSGAVPTNFNLTAPQVLVSNGASQNGTGDAQANHSISTAGAITLRQGAGAGLAVSANDFGGSLSLTGSRISDGGVIIARSGKITLTATAGDVELTGNAVIDAAGSAFTIVDHTTFAPGGSVKLLANSGSVVVGAGAEVDVSAAGLGYAGTLAIETADSGTALLLGELKGNAAFGDLGGSLSINAGHLAGQLPWSSFTGFFGIALGHGDIQVARGTTLTSREVQLTANDGSIIIDGTIDARAPGGGGIALYGAGLAGTGGTRSGGVSVNAGALLDVSHLRDDPANPRYASTSTQIPNGGTITLGTTGTPDGTTNSTYGNENVQPAGSGRIYVDSRAVLNLSGDLTNRAARNGELHLRAPVLANNTVNVSFNGLVVGASSVALDAYATWSTTDNSTGAKHFDGIIDPAGWYKPNGAMVDGTWTQMTALGTATLSGTTLGGFASAPTSIVLTGGGGSGATATATVGLDDAVLVITDGGVYTSRNDTERPTIAISGGGGTGARGKASMGINSITITDGGSGYDPNNPPTVSFLPSGDPWGLNRNAKGIAIVDAGGHITGVTITDPGRGFFTGTDFGTFTIPAPTIGSAAQGMIDTVKVTGVTVNSFIENCCSAGSGYTSAPTVTFNGGAVAPGQQGASPAQVALQIKGLTVTSPGAGYTSPPTGFVVTRADGSTATGMVTFALGNTNAVQTNGVISAGSIVLVGSGSFTPISGLINTDHRDFYQTTLAGFVQNLFAGNAAAIKSNSFSSVDAALVHLRPEIALVNPDSAVNKGNITVASNWNLGAGSVVSTTAMTANLTYRTAAKEAGTLTLRAVNDINVKATISDGFFVTAGNGTALVSSIVANSPANSPRFTVLTGNTYERNTTTTADVMPATIDTRGSFSYDFVAGAAGLGSSVVAPSANPDLVVQDAPAGSGNITIDGHTTYRSLSTGASLAYIPTLVRTGTGSIQFAAAGDVKWLDQLAPAAVYTGGRALGGSEFPSAADFTKPTVNLTTLNWTGLVTHPVWSIDGGAVTIDAGGSIVGIEAPLPDVPGANGSQFGIANGFTGKMWSAWYYRSGKSNGTNAPFSGSGNLQTSTWVNFGSFQGVGALGGGDVVLRAGGDVTDLAVGLPETIVVSGGKLAASPPVMNYYGGGDLIVRAGGDLNSSTFLVGRGNGDIRIDGAVQVTARNPITGLRTTAPANISGTNAVGTVDLPLLLAVQDGFIDLTSGGSITLGGIFDPAAILSFATTPLAGNAVFTSYGVTLPGTPFTSGSGVSLTTRTGDLAVADLGLTTKIIFGRSASGTENAAWPANVEMSALMGDITLARTNANSTWPALSPSTTGGLQILAGGSVQLLGIDMPDPNTSVTQYIGGAAVTLAGGAYVSPLGIPLANLKAALHDKDTEPSFVIAGSDIIGLSSNTTITNMRVIEPALIGAGRNISNFTFVGQNNSADDVTSVIAGQDMKNDSITLYGPGSLVLSSGRDMGPFQQSQLTSTNTSYRGVLAIGDGRNAPLNSNGQTLAVKSYLPARSADITLLFGVGAGVDYASAIAFYVNPANTGSGGIDLLDDIAHQLGQPRQSAWARFQNLPAARQQLLVQHAFVDFLGQVARDYKNPASLYYGQYQRAYDAIATLFPAALGYPSERGGNSNITTGKLNIAQSLIQTQLGSDITVLGPGGGIVAGTSGRDILKQNQQGIVTTAGGSIGIFTNDDIRVNQSRITTAQGGDIDIFVANGDIDAGSGPKTLISNPVIQPICNVNGFCRVNPNGLVTGAGIAALVTLPSQDPRKSNVTLAAPRGIIDLGAAGIRAGGDITLVATRILNSYNVQAGGVVIGMPTLPAINIGALTTASNATAATQQGAAPAARSNDRPSIIIVEVLGYGGGGGNEPEPAPKDEPYTIKKKQSYNTDSPLQVVGLGELNAEQRKRLVEDGAGAAKDGAPPR
uniref:Filamentous haemagglutinin family outer membrane protein n=1 Tax=Rhodopseudomonas palustris (strain BisA53) TaxID=316055 RepID=Q07N90_RHOP5